MVETGEEDPYAFAKVFEHDPLLSLKRVDGVLDKVVTDVEFITRMRHQSVEGKVDMPVFRQTT